MDFTECAQCLRDAYDAQLGIVAADEMTNRAVQQAQADFAVDVQQSDWRKKRGKRRAYL